MVFFWGKKFWTNLPPKNLFNFFNREQFNFYVWVLFFSGGGTYNKGEGRGNLEGFIKRSKREFLFYGFTLFSAYFSFWGNLLFPCLILLKLRVLEKSPKSGLARRSEGKKKTKTLTFFSVITLPRGFKPEPKFFTRGGGAFKKTRGKEGNCGGGPKKAVRRGIFFMGKHLLLEKRGEIWGLIKRGGTPKREQREEKKLKAIFFQNFRNAYFFIIVFNPGAGPRGRGFLDPTFFF